MNARLVACAAAILWIQAPPTFAQTCVLTDTGSECFEKKARALGYSTTRYRAAANKQSASALDALRTIATGPNPSLARNASISDFLSLLNFSSNSGPLSQSLGEDGALAVDYSARLNGLSGSVNVAARLNQPKLLSEVENGVSAERAARLKEELGAGDDFRIAIAYNYEGQIAGKHFGRSSALYESLSGKLLEHAAVPSKTDEEAFADMDLLHIFMEIFDAELPNRAKDPKFTEYRDKLQQSLESGTANYSERLARLASDPQLKVRFQAPINLVYHCLDNYQIIDLAGYRRRAKEFATCLTEAYISKFEQNAKATILQLGQLRKNLNNAGFFKLTQLINRQPQLILKAFIRHRDELVGPDEHGAELRLETSLGQANVNDLLRDVSRHGHCIDGIPIAAKAEPLCMQAISTYISQASEIQNPENGWWLTLAVKWTQSDTLSIDRPADELSLYYAPKSALLGSLVFGRYLALDAASTRPRTRLDLGLDYQDVSGDALRNNRATGTATLSRELTDGTSLSVGLVWANKPEYRADAQQDLSAHIGLNYKIGGQTK